jgi:hypothetical protein
MKRTLSIAIIATVLLGATAALYHPGNAAIPLVQAAEGPFKVRPPKRAYPISPGDLDYVMDQLAIPYIKDKKIRDYYAKTFWCWTPAMDYLQHNPEPDPALLKKRAERLVARYKQD